MLVVRQDAEDVPGRYGDVVEGDGARAGQALPDPVRARVGEHPRMGRVHQDDQEVAGAAGARADDEPVGHRDAGREGAAPVEDPAAAAALGGGEGEAGFGGGARRFDASGEQPALLGRTHVEGERAAVGATRAACAVRPGRGLRAGRVLW
ncbi:hypothetical protein ACFUGD_11485 [Streptomyces sp. NPDC057217]|uniref:hypothetical protein n=1 Tax=Streptomyces sp. NPDC057217 TaxID=3346054 RepID=UPI0036306953